MKVYNLFIAILLSLVFGTSCTNEEINDFQPNQKLQTKAIEKSIEVSDVAQLISMVEIDDEIMNEVKTGVENSCKYGLDEEYRFADMLNPGESKISRSINIPILIQRMKAKYEELDLEILNSDFFDLLENSELQINWQYSDSWNGLDKPIIVCGSEDEKSVYIFKGDNNEIDTIPFTKEFIQQNTVWVISENSTPYDELPDFYKDEFINKNGVVFLSRYAAKKMACNNRAIGSDSGIYLDKFNALHSYEGGLSAGGPELNFIWCHAGPSLSNVPTGFVNTYRYNMKGSEVGKDIQLDYRIRHFWSENEVENVLVVFDSDGGKDKTTTRNMRYIDLFGKETIVSAKFKDERRDEFVFDKTFTRKQIYEDNYTTSGDLRQYKNSENLFWVTLAVK